MYVLKPGIKRDPQRRWALPDRIFFAHGACHILAGVYLRSPPLPGFHAEWIIPADERPGTHIFLTDGQLAFDFHGYSTRTKLLAHHAKCWSAQYENWGHTLERVEFNLLNTPELNQRKMLGPDQYLYDATQRAERFLARIDHAAASGRVPLEMC